MVAISLHSVVPVRAEAREGAEQLTQMLFGETCSIVDEISHWARVRLDLDGQEGWVDSKMICPMKPDEYDSYRKAYSSAATVVFPMAYAMSENNSQTIPLAASTRLTNYKDGHFELLGVGFQIESAMVRTQPLGLTLQNLLQIVRFFLNVPYLWGGKNAFGMDCSGFTQVVMSLFGISLLRNANEQATQGVKVKRLADVKAGDLVFFDHEQLNDGAVTPSAISHVGIVLDSERVIHCSGRVKVEKLDKTGIFSKEASDEEHPDGRYTHHLAAIRRML